ncbi:M4 family metallopeptidase [Pleionea sediminis]|uniref:M4 family metallopeptidase n=1 Tax=Pleionea sediminis TaxID=2569479 RepID=UPI001185BC6B|nr:M4 family metallopeptidase [Pleionea sediminis]
MKNNLKLKTASLVVGASFAAASMGINAESSNEFSIKTTNKAGAPSFATGKLGKVQNKSAGDTLKNILRTKASYGFTGKEDFSVKRQWLDALGKMHTHFDQTINGIKVYGTSMILHANVTQSSLKSGDNIGEVYAVTGALALEDKTDSLSKRRVDTSNPKSALAAANKVGNVSGKPELAYIYVPELGKAKLAWKIDVKYNSNQGFEHDVIFFDVNSSEELARHPQVHRAKRHYTYTMNNNNYNHYSRPGTLLCSNNESCGDTSAQNAHDGASIVYDYYLEKHGRDGVDGNGMNMISSVHTGSNWNNAVWYQNQMMYGDGDGNYFSDLTGDFDVIAHELTHGVTQFTAGLIYQNESGALNEAMSDIMGISAEAYKNGSSSPAWKIGDEVFTPSQSGDALRYMDDPTEDGSSYDYYPERYVGTQDNGGVHWNSGIANLAYVLLVDGGTHPRNKTTVNVPGIGLGKAEKIFYRALTTYFNQSTNFSAARTGTAQAALDLYGQAEKTAVETAWCAVGVGSCPSGDGDNGDGDNSGDNVLENGAAKTQLSASRGQDIEFTMEVPAGATDINFAMSGGSGDADLYVKFGSAPTDSSYDCRPYKSGNSESCTGEDSGGTYYVRIKAYSSFSGVSLVGSYTADDGGSGDDGSSDLEPIDVSASDISVGRGEWQRFEYALPDGYSSMTVSISGGSGDADLYVNYGSQSTTSNYDCRPYKSGNNEVCNFNNPQVGTWYLDIRGYRASSGITIRLQAQP